jgi:aryl-alcohol dehydrogenase-like predicted oxidoreductase
MNEPNSSPTDENESTIDRRAFFRRAGLAWAGAAIGARWLGEASLQAQDRSERPPSVSADANLPFLEEKNAPGQIPMRRFGKTDIFVSAIGVGGFSIASKSKNIPEDVSIRIVQEAVDNGITFMDNAWEYNEGVSEERMGKALSEGGRRDKVFLMTKVCTHGRDRKVAMQQLEESLKRLRTDHLDLWQVHECVYWNDPERHFMKGGVIEALDQAKKEGKVRFVGFTGHKDPAIHLAMLAYDYPFDACQLPLNVFDGTFHSFEQRVLPELSKRGIMPLGMKTFNGNARAIKQGVVSAEEALRYSMSLPVLSTIVGFEALEDLQKNLATARDFKRLAAPDMMALRNRFSDNVASDGRFELYKTTNEFDADIGRGQHGFPAKQEKTT